VEQVIAPNLAGSVAVRFRQTGGYVASDARDVVAVEADGDGVLEEMAGGLTAGMKPSADPSVQTKVLAQAGT
jgi:hypothetical protein